MKYIFAIAALLGCAFAGGQFAVGENEAGAVASVVAFILGIGALRT